MPDIDTSKFLNQWTSQDVSYLRRDLLTYAVGIGCAFPEPVFRTGNGAVEAEELSADLPEPTGNPMGSSAYRRRMVGVIAARAYRTLTGGMH